MQFTDTDGEAAFWCELQAESRLQHQEQTSMMGYGDTRREEWKLTWQNGLLFYTFYMSKNEGRLLVQAYNHNFCFLGRRQAKD